MPAEADKPANLLDLEGLVRGSADEKGRVKVPAVIRKHLQDSGETIFFVTTFDVRTVRIYTRDAWSRNKAILDNSTSPSARSILYIAKVYGSPASMDKQGRIPIAAQLRKDVGIGDEEVYFEQSKEHVEIYSKKIHEERLVDALSNLPAKMQEVEELGVR